MERNTGERKLDTPEARAEFRSKYFDSAFKAAFSITGSYSDAEPLARQLFDSMEQRFKDVPLPKGVELYILSQINLLYAKMDMTTDRRAPATRTYAVSAAEPEPLTANPEPFTVGPEPTAEQEPVAPPPAAPAAAEPVAPPPPAPRRDADLRERYDPALTELWMPDDDTAPPKTGAAEPEPDMAAQSAPPEDGDGSAENERSIPLTILNTVLFIALMGSAVFALAEAGLFKLFT